MTADIRTAALALLNELGGLPDELEQQHIDAARAVIRVVTPTREQIADALDSHTRQLDTGACCGWVLDTPHDQYLHWADALLVLMAGLAEGESSG